MKFFTPVPGHATLHNTSALLLSYENANNITNTHTHAWTPFTALLDFVQDYTDEQAPER